MLINKTLQEQVLAALERESGIDATQIGVSVADGVVTLQGRVTTTRHKWLAERAARRVLSVRAVANDLEVANGDGAATDSAVAQAVANAIDSDTAIPAGRVKATVRHRWVTLSGTVTWHFQREAAERAARRVAGVKGVANSVKVGGEVNILDLRVRITDAFRRAAEQDAHSISIQAYDGTVVLTGSVHSRSERDAAERVALAAPGVSHVDVELVVTP